MNALLKCSATLFGLGKKVKAPGTVASLVTLPFAFLLSSAGPFVHMSFALLFTAFSIFSAEAYERATGTHDLGEVVIDEVAGVLIASVWLPAHWSIWLLVFLLFRVLDIFKPFPISWLDRKVPGGVGVVADDVAAGLVTNMLLQWGLQSGVLVAWLTWMGINIV